MNKQGRIILLPNEGIFLGKHTFQDMSDIFDISDDETSSASSSNETGGVKVSQKILRKLFDKKK